MEADLTVHTGCAGSKLTLNIDWFDHNGVKQKDVVTIEILPEDKPRTLQVSVNEKAVFQATSDDSRYLR